MRTLLLAVIALMTGVLASNLLADLCPQCQDKMFVMSVGKCCECTRATTSNGLQLCPQCSRTCGKCEACGATLPGCKPAATSPASAPASQPASMPTTLPAKNS
jgi:hypothetical protein